MPQYVIEREIPGAGNLIGGGTAGSRQKIGRRVERYGTGNQVAAQLRDRRQNLLRVPGAGRGNGSRTCAPRRLSGKSHFRSAAPDGSQPRRLIQPAFQAPLPGSTSLLSASCTACSTGIAQPSIHAVRPAALPSVRRANSSAFSSRGCLGRREWARPIVGEARRRLLPNAAIAWHSIVRPRWPRDIRELARCRVCGRVHGTS